MKTSAILSALFVSSALLTTACTPRDVSVTDKDTRAKIQAQNARKTGKPVAGGADFKIGGYSGSALLADRAIEALEVIRLATSEEKTEKSQYKVSEKTALKDGEGYSVVLNAANDVLSYDVDGVEYKSTLSKRWNVTVSTAAGKIQSVTAVAEKAKTTIDKEKGVTFLNVAENEIKLVLAAVEGSDSYKVSLESKGSVNGRLNKAANTGSMDTSVSFLVDGAGLESGKATLTKFDGKFVFTKKDTTKPNTSSAKGELTVDLEGFCHTAQGKLTLGGSNPKNMILSKTGIVVEGTKFKMTTATCGKSPTVDFSRLFVW
ncbi:MAG: hypothetical protein OM95_10350 [Bdellovibrio sp. ArHS]|uniref:hypothetical protein n=1 Tax=Bdellovibrio sp. ArHS TaxID=1569284 RepID=UPI000582B5F2|nr:hypothetical protein [Bdellovibrio sp. ArHS]KHD88163.1 MAG: hypothetical protein OM95_10350 [Bdellovibrio sp. ArHS]